MTARPRPSETIAALYDAVRTRDLDLVTAFFAGACEFVDVPTGSVSRGHADFRAYMNATWRTFPDFAPVDAHFVDDGTRVAAELVIRGTHRGAFAGIPATGRVVSWPAAAFYDLDGAGKVTREVYFYDIATITDQLTGGEAR